MTADDSVQRDQSGCTVDWSWLDGQEIESAWSNLERLELRFKRAHAQGHRGGMERPAVSGVRPLQGADCLKNRADATLY